MSKSILISLIGKETIPNYRAYKEFSPDTLVQVYSDQTKNAASILEKMVTNETRVIPIEVGGFDFHEVLKALQLKIEISPDDHLTINLTGGTKMMALALYEFGLKAQNTCNVYYFYIDTDQKIHWLIENRTDSFSEKLSLEELIVLSGQKIVTKDTYTDLAKIFAEPLAIVKTMLSGFESSKNWDKFLKNIIKKVRDNSNDYESNRQVIQRFFRNGNCGEFEIIWDDEGIQIMHKDKLFIEMFQTEKQIEWFLFNAGWFELLTAQKFSRIYNENGMYMNVKFSLLSSDFLEKNEVDILINDGGKLIFIECKSGIVTSENINTIKVRKETYGGLIADNVLVTRYDLKQSTRPYVKLIIEKCDDLGIIIKQFDKI